MTHLPAHLAPLAAPRNSARPAMRFDLRELAGSLGDLGTFLPLSLALALTCGMHLGLIFIFAGLMNIATGVCFRQPIPVQPMKAIAAVAIAEGLTTGSIAAAGILTGAIMLALALLGAVDWIERTIPRPVIRGIQAGVGIKLALTGFAWLADLPLAGWDSTLVALVAGAVVLGFAGRRQPVLLYVFFAGFVLIALGGGHADTSRSVEQATMALALPTSAEWWTGLTRGAIPQLPLTLLNSVIAVCALSADYYPGRGVSPKRMAASVGLMNLLCVPLGGMPMCHGAGGLASQHAFGARTGGSVVMLGVLKVAAGALLGTTLAAAVAAYPASILAVMVIVAGLVLARAARDAFASWQSFIVMAVTAGGILALGTMYGFLIGAACAGLGNLIARRSAA